MNIHPDNPPIVDRRTIYIDGDTSIEEIDEGPRKQMVRLTFLSFNLMESENWRKL